MRTRIKICGLTRPGDVRTVVEEGADAFGLVFHEPSPRAVTVAQARSLAAGLPPFVSVVALFVNAPRALVEQVMQEVRPDYLQFHGDETPEDCAWYGMPYFKAVRMRPGQDLVQYATRYGQARALLVDAYVDGQPGGTGQTFDWNLLPRCLPLPLILSGGLGPENVAQAVRRIRPWAVDVSSGVEEAPGLKAVEKVRRFVQGVRDEDV